MSNRKGIRPYLNAYCGGLAIRKDDILAFAGAWKALRLPVSDDSGDVTGIIVNFNAATAIEANRPSLIRVPADMTEFA